MSISESLPPPESKPSGATTNKQHPLADHEVTDLSKARATQALDLAMTSSQIDRYAQAEIFIPFLHLPIAKYTEKIVASSPSATKLSCEELTKAIIKRS